MKYIITENRIESMIKEYILKNYDAMDVDFKTKRVHLGSGPNEKGETKIVRKVVEVYINNVKSEKKYNELKEIKSSLWSVLEDLFGIDLTSYGNEWELVVYSVERKEI